MSVTLLNYQISQHEIASIHRTGCRDIERNARQHAAVAYEYANVAEALADFIDEEMVEMGYDISDVKVHQCCKDQPSA